MGAQRTSGAAPPGFAAAHQGYRSVLASLRTSSRLIQLGFQLAGTQMQHTFAGVVARPFCPGATRRAQAICLRAMEDSGLSARPAMTVPANEGVLLQENLDGIAVLSLNRAAARNSLSVELLEAM